MTDLTLRRTFTRAAVALALLGAACATEDEDPAGPSGPSPAEPGPIEPGPVEPAPTVVGTYALISVDGDPVPAPLGEPVEDDDFTINASIESGLLILNPDSTYLFEVHGRVVATGVPFEQPLDFETAGIYEVGEGTILLREPDSNSGVVHSLDGGTITMISPFPGPDGEEVLATLVFRK
jgi:hypothetical protein